MSIVYDKASNVLSDDTWTVQSSAWQEAQDSYTYAASGVVASQTIANSTHTGASSTHTGGTTSGSSTTTLTNSYTYFDSAPEASVSYSTGGGSPTLSVYTYDTAGNLQWRQPD